MFIRLRRTPSYDALKTLPGRHPRFSGTRSAGQCALTLIVYDYQYSDRQFQFLISDPKELSPKIGDDASMRLYSPSSSSLSLTHAVLRCFKNTAWAPSAVFRDAVGRVGLITYERRTYVSTLHVKR
ncbi:hypothetical protein NDU88_001931 [Pleurodeles waltl]|uniref:Uncharacterized protein n=1 Tax=Pleurodeles waltl TaxID=8319 RepID=A0AAV7WJU1_PLEWA|nr:hypothetical protein NDU88_001931 [Pleurodeles waltl]